MWNKSARRSEVLIALPTAQGLVRVQYKSLVRPEDYFHLLLAPCRSRIAKRPMQKTPEDPSDIIALFPFTTQMSFAKPFWCGRLAQDAARANLKVGSWEGSVVSTVSLGDLGPKSRATKLKAADAALARDVAEGGGLCLPGTFEILTALSEVRACDVEVVDRHPSAQFTVEG